MHGHNDGKNCVREAGRAAWFTPDEGQARSDFWAVYEDHFELIRRETFRKLGLQSEFGPALSVSIEEARAHHDRFLRAWGTPKSHDGDDLEAVLGECREFFAARGVSINGWCDACMLVEVEVTPLLIAAHGSDPARLAGTLSVLHRYAARITSVIAREFLSIEACMLAAERQQAEQASARFTHISESGVVGVLVCNLLESVTEANDGFLKMFGYSREELASGEIPWASMTPPEWQRLDESAIRQLRAFGKTQPWEKEYFHKDGRRVPVLVGMATLDSPQTLAFVVDISDRKRLAAMRARNFELETQNRHLREASRLESEPVAIMSHEVRAALKLISGFAELLHDREVGQTFPPLVVHTSSVVTPPNEEFEAQWLRIGVAAVLVVQSDDREPAGVSAQEAGIVDDATP